MVTLSQVLAKHTPDPGIVATSKRNNAGGYGTAHMPLTLHSVNESTYINKKFKAPS